MFNLIKVSSKTDLPYYVVLVQREVDNNSACLFLFGKEDHKQILSLFTFNDYENMDFQNVPPIAVEFVKQSLRWSPYSSTDLIIDKDSSSGICKNIYDIDGKNIKMVLSDLGLVYVEIYNMGLIPRVIGVLKSFVQKSDDQFQNGKIHLNLDNYGFIGEKAATAVIGCLKQQKIIIEILGFESIDISTISRIPIIEVNGSFYDIKSDDYARTPLKKKPDNKQTEYVFSPHSPCYKIKWPQSQVEWEKDSSSYFEMTLSKREHYEIDKLSDKIHPASLDLSGVDYDYDSAVSVGTENYSESGEGLGSDTQPNPSSDEEGVETKPDNKVSLRESRDSSEEVFQSLGSKDQSSTESQCISIGDTFDAEWSDSMCTPPMNRKRLAEEDLCNEPKKECSDLEEVRCVGQDVEGFE